MATDKNQALLRAGISPKSHGMRKGTHVHWDRKRSAKNGQRKHKGNFD